MDIKIAITGANGYVGQNIIRKLEQSNNKIFPIKRHLLYGDTSQLSEHLFGYQAIINLAGAPIIQRWTKKNKVTIYNSRVLTTKNLCKAINMLPEEKQPKVFISMSAAGIYRENLSHDELSSGFANNFAARVVNDWEAAIFDLQPNIRRVVFRTSVVLGKQSQTISRLRPLFKLGLGAKIGNGKQPFPFVHIADLVKAFTEAVTNENYGGIYNLSAPENASNADFTKAFAKALNRPALLLIPAFVFKILYGKASEILLKNPILVPKRLLEQGFQFQYPTISTCVKEIAEKN